MTTYIFKGYDVDSGVSLTRYGFREKLTSDEVKEKTQYDWWEFPYVFVGKESMKARVDKKAEHLHYEWTKKHGSAVRVRVFKDGKEYTEWS